MNTQTLTENFIDELVKITGPEYVFTDSESLEKYGQDETEDLVFLPHVVVKPANAQEISSIIRLAIENKIPVTPRGAGTGLSGGALPVEKGILLSTERLNKIISIDERNFQATVETGVVTQVFQEAVIAKGLFYPPDPSSRGSCFIGGNLAESSGGPKAVKYGVTKDYVLNLEVVLPTGEIIWTGANVLKNATGYNLTQLMIGSEGTLGIITKVVFRLIPHPSKDIVMLIPFKSAEQACEAVNSILHTGVRPSALEFMERDAIEWSAGNLNLEIDLPKDVEAHLLVEVDGNDLDLLSLDAEKIYEAVSRFDIYEPLFADSAQQKEDLWRIRRNVGHAVKSNSIYKEEDTVVPRAELPALIKEIKRISTKYNFKSVCYGHAGDGNLHVNIVRGNLSEKEWNENIQEGIKELFRYTVSVGGTISGEHGIGFVQRPYIDIAIGEKQLELMRQIKKVFDPNGILNPNKIF